MSNEADGFREYLDEKKALLKERRQAVDVVGRIIAPVLREIEKELNDRGLPVLLEVEIEHVELMVHGVDPEGEWGTLRYSPASLVTVALLRKLPGRSVATAVLAVNNVTRESVTKTAREFVRTVMG
jgi:hypothetical protein